MTGAGNFECPPDLYCGNVDMYPELNLEDEKIYDRLYMNFGVTNFNNLGTSLLTVFQMITSETWYLQIMNLHQLVLGTLLCCNR